jgi:hypothetical protein
LDTLVACGLNCHNNSITLFDDIGTFPLVKMAYIELHQSV